MQARYYDPVIGRFYSNDPVGMTNVHTFNRYAYANNNPYKYTDPDGKSALALCAGGPIACGAGVALTAIGVLTAAKSSQGDPVAAIITIKNESSDLEIEGAVDLEDDLAGQEVIGEIEAGEGKVLEGMGDDKFDPETGTHDKVVKNRKNADGTQTEVHTERNRETQKVDKAKIKQDGKNSRKNNQ